MVRVGFLTLGTKPVCFRAVDHTYELYLSSTFFRGVHSFLFLVSYLDSKLDPELLGEWLKVREQEWVCSKGFQEGVRFKTLWQTRKVAKLLAILPFRCTRPAISWLHSLSTYEEFGPFSCPVSITRFPFSGRTKGQKVLLPFPTMSVRFGLWTPGLSLYPQNMV